jgi:hypothetical protein
VGIGTSSPASKLDVNGSITVPDGEGYYFGSSTYRVEGKDDGASARIAFITANSEAMRITSTGAVGIGTDSPDVKLDVYNSSGWGEVHFDGTSGGELALKQSGTTYGGIYANNSSGCVLQAVGASTPLSIRTNGSERMRIDSSGAVGIGTSSPVNRLDISSGNQGVHIDRIAAPYYGASIALGNDVGSDNKAWRMATRTANNLVFETKDVGYSYGTNPDAGATTGWTERMRISSSGKVGIGTTSPSREVHVSQTTGPTGIRIEGGANQGGFIECWSPATSKGVYFGNAKPIIGGSYLAEEGAVFTESGYDFIVYSGSGGENARFLSNGGITFNGDTASANALADYEEGTWTPNVDASGTTPSVSFNNRSGFYTKVGRTVTLTFYFHLSSCSGGSGHFKITGLPYSMSLAGTSARTHGASAMYFVSDTSNSDPCLMGYDNNSLGFLCADGTGGWLGNHSWEWMPVGAVAGSAIQGTVTYITA